MHVQDPARSLDKLGRQVALSGTLERIRITLNLSVAELGAYLQVTPAECEQILKGELAPAANSAMSLSERLGLSLERLIGGDIDYAALSKRFNGDRKALPERYSYAMLSRKRTSINVLKWLEDFYGWRFQHRVLNALQVDICAFNDADELINVNFLSDLCATLQQYGCNEEQFRMMGKYSVVTNYNSHIGDEYRRLHHPSEIVEASCTYLAHYYDRNMNYSLQSLDSTRAIINAPVNPALQDAFKSHSVGNVPYCQTKAGVFSAFPGYLNLPPAKVREIRCIHRGDALCQYEIDYEDADLVLRRTAKEAAGAVAH